MFSPDLCSFIDHLEASDTIEEMGAVFDKAMQNLGFDKFAYLGLNLPGRNADPLLISTYSTDWTDHYMGEGYYDIDPVVLQGNASVLPFAWGHEESKVGYNKKQHQLFNEASEFNIMSGFTTPIHGRGSAFSGITIATEEKEDGFLKQVKAYQHLIHLMALHFHECISRQFGSNDNQGKKITLSGREIECLTWAAQGKSVTDTAEILHIGINTVKFHLKNIREKLDVATTNQAVVKAIIDGLIRP